MHSEHFRIFFRRFRNCESKFNISARNNDNKTIQNSIFIHIYTEKSLHSSIDCVCSQARCAPSTARERDNTGPRGGCQLPALSLQSPRFPVIASIYALSQWESHIYNELDHNHGVELWGLFSVSGPSLEREICHLRLQLGCIYNLFA